MTIISDTPQALIQRLVRFNNSINVLHDRMACTPSKVTDDSRPGWTWSIEWKAGLLLRWTLAGWKNELPETSGGSTKLNIKSSIPSEKVKCVSSTSQ